MPRFDTEITDNKFDAGNSERSSELQSFENETFIILLAQHVKFFLMYRLLQ